MSQGNVIVRLRILLFTQFPVKLRDLLKYVYESLKEYVLIVKV